MRAVTCTDGTFEVVDLPRPVPGRGQLLLDVHRAGICGSDLHARRHADELVETSVAAGYDGVFRSDQAVVFGHEIYGEVAARGPGTRGYLPVGTRVVAFPLRRSDGTVHMTGMSPHAPGAYAEQVVVEESMTFAVPDGVPADVAALTEPMAVGLHAVRRSGIGRRQVAVVVGCGPVGLAVIAMLKASGVKTVVASDFSARRRALATACGADVVVDAAEGSPFDAVPGRRGHVRGATQVFERAVDAMDTLRRVPVVPWERVWQLAAATGATASKHPVVFECVGARGMIDHVIATAPLYSRVVVVGVCMEPDTLRPAIAINKEIDLRFVFGYDPGEFHEALRLLAAGRVDVGAVVTGTVGLHGVAAAFDALGRADTHAKILVDPRSDVATIA